MAAPTRIIPMMVEEAVQPIFEMFPGAGMSILIIESSSQAAVGVLFATTMAAEVAASLENRLLLMGRRLAMGHKKDVKDQQLAIFQVQKEKEVALVQEQAALDIGAVEIHTTGAAEVVVLVM